MVRNMTTMTDDSCRCQPLCFAGPAQDRQHVLCTSNDGKASILEVKTEGVSSKKGTIRVATDVSRCALQTVEQPPMLKERLVAESHKTPESRRRHRTLADLTVSSSSG